MEERPGVAALHLCEGTQPGTGIPGGKNTVVVVVVVGPRIPTFSSQQKNEVPLVSFCKC